MNQLQSPREDLPVELGWRNSGRRDISGLGEAEEGVRWWVGHLINNNLKVGAQLGHSDPEEYSQRCSG